MIGSTIGPWVASREVMRSVCLLSSAALVLSSGCVAVGPAAGAGVGVGIGAIRKTRNEDASLFNHGAVGALIGLAVEAAAVGVLVYQLDHKRGGGSDGDGVLAPF